MKAKRNLIPLFLLGAAVCLSCPSMAMAEGNWILLQQPAPAGIGTMLLLSDGTVMAEGSSPSGTNTWYRLTPGSNGGYTNGTWSARASMNYTRLYFSSQVLPDGRVFVAGAEYGTGTTNAEVYNPFYSPNPNTWAKIPVPSGLITVNNVLAKAGDENNAGFSDSASMTLANGDVLVTPVDPVINGATVLFHPDSDTLSLGPTNFYGGYNEDEASLVKLPDDSILTVDFEKYSSERYIPALNRWIGDATVPDLLYDIYGEESGAAFLLPNGKAFFIGSTPVTALYTPSGSTSPGSWVAGPNIPGNLGAPDAPAAMMVNGKILCALSPTPSGTNSNNIFTTPTSFFEYDYSAGPAGAFTQVHAPGGVFTLASATFPERMLDLPDGTVLFNAGQNQLAVYKPDASPLAAGKPVVQTIERNPDGSLHLSGTMFNGISSGAGYGDDVQADSNYPLIRFTDASGNVTYGITHNWSSTSVMTSNKVATTEATIPGSVADGSQQYTMQIVANGIGSDPLTFYPFDFPTVSFTAPTAGAVGSDTFGPLIAGNADDTDAAIATVRVALNRGSDGAWYDFISGNWGTTTLDLHRDILNASDVAGQHSGWIAQLPVMAAGNYSVQAQSVNLHSNASPWVAVAFSIESAPAVAFNPLTNTETVFDFSQLGGTINEAGSVSFRIEQFDAEGITNRYWNGSAWIANGNDPAVYLAATVTGGTWAPAGGVALPTRGQTRYGPYFLRAIGTDAAGDSSTNEILVTRSAPDTSVPVLTLNAIHNGDVITNQTIPGLSGSALDNGEPGIAIASVTLYLNRFTGSDVLYWDGSSWSSTPAVLTANYNAQTVAWQLTTPLPSGANLPNAGYQVQIVAANNESPAGNTTLSVLFSVDYHPVYIFTYGSQSGLTPNNNWSDPANWDVGSVPTPDAHVIINDYSPDSTSLGNIQLYRLDISGGQLTTAGMSVQKLNLSGGGLSGGLVTLVTNGVFNWSGGILYSSLTVPSNGVVMLAGVNGTDYNLYGTLTNGGTVRLASGNLQLVGGCISGGIGELVNLPGGLVDLQDDVSIFSACSTEPFYNDGLVRKSGGTGTSGINCIFNNSGTLEVQTGTVSVNGGGASTGQFVADVGATLTYGGNYEVDGVLTGAGTNLLNGTTLNGTGVITNGLFVWSSGSLGTVSGLTVASNGVVMLAGVNGTDYNLFGTLTNGGTVRLASGNLQLVGGCISGGIGELVNLPGGLVDLQADVAIHGNCTSEPFYNGGLVRKSGGTGTSGITCIFYNSGTLEAQTGTVSVNGGGTDTGSLVADLGATVAFGGDYEVDSTLASGGQYLFASGTVTLNGNFSGTNGVLAGSLLAGQPVISGKLSWTSGGFAGGSMITVANSGVVTLAGVNGTDYNLYGTLTNAGTVRLASGNLQLVGGCISGGIGELVNLPGGLVDLQADVAIHGNCTSEPFYNAGLVRKSGGTGTSGITCIFNNSGTLEVQTGTVSVNGGGASTGQFVADVGATLTYGGNYEVDGVLTGAGTNLLNGTTLNGTGVITNGLFVWSSGSLGTVSGLTVASNGVVLLAGVNGTDYNLFGTLTNGGTVRLASGNLQLVGGCIAGGIGELVNLPGGLVDLQADVAIHGNCTSEPFYNAGLVRKSGGTGTSGITCIFYNSGTLEAQTGTISVNGGGTDTGSLVADLGATVAFGGDYEVDSTLASGGQYLFASGTVTLNGNLSGTNGVLAGSTLAGNPIISGKLNWTSGGFAGGSMVTVANSGVVTLAGVNGTDYNLNGALTNAGTVRLASGNLQLVGGCLAGGIGELVNLPGGLVDLQGEVAIHGYCTSEPFYNAGLVRKSGGTGTSGITCSFNNSGTVEVQTGNLAINGAYALSGSPQLKLVLGGLNPGTQFSQESFAGATTLGGGLSVTLTNGFSPTNGQSFAIINYGSASGQFAASQLPALPFNLGWLVTYGPAGVTLTVVPATVISDGTLLANGHFTFTFNGPNASSAVILGSSNLMDWIPLETNTPFTGSLFFDDPSAVGQPMRFYRVQMNP